MNRWTAPNWCEPCGGYRPRDHECERPRRQVPAPVRENIDEDQLARIPEARDPKYVSGWRAGWEACMQAIAERTVA